MGSSEMVPLGKRSRLSQNLSQDRTQDFQPVGGPRRDREGPTGKVSSAPQRQLKLLNEHLKGVDLVDAVVASHDKGDVAEADATAR